MLGSNPGGDAICWLNLLKVLSFAPNGFTLGTPGFPLSSQTNTFKFQFDLERTNTFKRLLKNSEVPRGSTNHKLQFYTSI